MGEPKLLFHNNKGHLEAWSIRGILWSERKKSKLGSFTENEIFDCNNNLIARIEGFNIFGINGEIIGSIQPIEGGRKIANEPHSFYLLKSGNKIGKCDYGKSMSAAVLALIGGELNEIHT